MDNIDYMLDKGKSSQEILVEMREATGMTRKALSEYLKIPYRTMTDWERGERTMPDYVLRLMFYHLEAEGMLNTNTRR